MPVLMPGCDSGLKDFGLNRKRVVRGQRSGSLIIPRAAVEERGEDAFFNEGVAAPLAFANLSSTPVPRREIGKRPTKFNYVRRGS